MKKTIIGLLLIAYASVGFCADVSVTIKVKESHVGRLRDVFVEEYPEFKNKTTEEILKILIEDSLRKRFRYCEEVQEYKKAKKLLQGKEDLFAK